MSARFVPETMREALSMENEATLHQLVQTIDYAEGLTLLFARCNIPTLRQALAWEAVQRLSARQIDVIEIEYPEGAPDLRDLLREQLARLPASGRKRAVFLYGVEHAIPPDELDTPFLITLNMGRELFHRDAPHPLVFWLPEYALTALVRGAPDFWAWRSGVFDFETEPRYRQEALQVYTREEAEWRALANLTVEQKRRRQRVLENLLTDYQELPQDNRTYGERGEILFALGQLHLALGEVQEARHFFHQSLEMAQQLGNPGHIAANVHNLAAIAQIQGDYNEARCFYQQSLEIAQKLGNQMRIAAGLHQLGSLAQAQGDYAEARRLFQQSLEIDKKLGHQAGVATTLYNLGTIVQSQGDYAEARRLFQQSLEISQNIGNQTGLIGPLHSLGIIAQRQGNYEEARRLYQQSLEIAQRLGQQAHIASGLHQLGTIAQEQGDYEEARRLYQQSLEIAQRLGVQAHMAASLHQLGILAQKQGNYDEANHFYQHSLKIAEALRDQPVMAATLHNLGTIAQKQGKDDEAYRLFRQSLEIKKQLGDQIGIATSLHQLAILARDQGDYDEAYRLCKQSLELFTNLQSPYADAIQQSLIILENEKLNFPSGTVCKNTTQSC